ncbi:MAG: hypothetical protein HY905_13245 [Deltaproteobacteria bacterium]|nr:hypothetical protein [Deltaproteobacteria bacterium]
MPKQTPPATLPPLNLAYIVRRVIATAVITQAELVRLAASASSALPPWKPN